jgi:GTP-binding protein HflX
MTLPEQGALQETALIINPVLTARGRPKEDGPRAELEEQLEEAEGLARAIALEVLATRVVRIANPSPGHLIGEGNRAEIAKMAEELKPSVIIVNHPLTPVQQRNLEREWKAKVIDRTGLILEIFGARAQTREGKIQVELAALEYQRSRLVRSWTHLERQRGGAGFMGGPGETQLEMDRRAIVDAIARLKKNLEQVRRNRDLQRRSREKVPFPIVALVGYTNAGKSTLFNRLTGASVFAEDLPFATLDPTVRKVTLENGQEVLFSDTVGFIADLPTHLIAAFRGTLEQVEYADIILHVRDISRADTAAQHAEVVKTLAALNVEYEQDARIVEAWNKIDAVPEEERDALRRAAKLSETDSFVISARSGEGLAALLEKIQWILAQGRSTVTLEIEPSDGKALAWLYKNATVLNREDEEGAIRLHLSIAPADFDRFRGRYHHRVLADTDMGASGGAGEEYERETGIHDSGD